MSVNPPPALCLSQEETASPSDLQSESSEQVDPSTSIPLLVTGNDTADHHPASEPEQAQQQTQQQASSSSPNFQRTETANSSEPAERNTQLPAVNTAPVAVASPTPVGSIVPPTSVAPVIGESMSSPEMTTSSLPPSIEPSVAALSITLLLISGVRHQFTMNEAYLEQHSVKAQSGKESLKDPFEMSVGQLKECIWKDWKDEWDQKPASAMFIRLIHFGRMLEDRNPLKDCRLNQDTPNVVHMTVRPPEVGDDEMTQRSTKGCGHSRDNGNGGNTPSCRCVIL